MTNSEKLLSSFSEDFFYKELVYADLKFVPEGGTEIELADLIINLEDVILAIQLKERNEKDRTQDKNVEEKWLKKKCKKAKEQIKDTISYINNEKVSFVNARGKETKINPNAEVVPLVVFENVSISEYEHLLRSHTADGLTVNCMSMDDFQFMCQELVSYEKFNPETPDAVWCSDITYIWTYEGFVYLTSIMDLFSRKIIAWVLSDTLEAKWVIDAVAKAKTKRGIKAPKMIHSDRGIQYVYDYVAATNGIERSYSKKAYPWDNACIESFHALIKREWLNRFKIVDYAHTYRLIFQYIETFYNTVRIHSHCDYMSPNEYEIEYRKNLKKQKLCA